MGLRPPVVGVHYPGNLAALCPWLPDGVACLDHVNRWRWPDGLRYTHCGREKGWTVHGSIRPLRSPNGFRAFLHIMGPGLVTVASDDDPSGVATYSQASAQFGCRGAGIGAK
jgi:hypothetical protein